MSKRSVFTTVTPLDPGITRETVLQTLHDHLEMIDLNPLVIERHPIKAPRDCTPEEFYCQWYALTDRVQYLPGGLAQGKVTYNACFHDLANGLQTHVRAPAGLDIKGKWTLGGSLPGEPKEAVELGLGISKNGGLYLREDVDMKCNIVMLGFVKKTLKKAHATLVARLLEKANLVEREVHNDNLSLFNGRRESSLHGYSGSLQPGHQSGTFSSDTSSLRSSLSQSPHISQQYATPLASPSYQSIDPAYRDARHSCQCPPEALTKDSLHPHHQPHPAHVMELPAEVPYDGSPSNHHELPARFYDN